MPRSPNNSPATITRGARGGMAIPNEDAILVIQAMVERQIPYGIAIRESEYLNDNGIYIIQFYGDETTTVCFFGRQYKKYDLPLKGSVEYRFLD